MMAPRGVMVWTDSLAFRVLRATASKALQGMPVPLAYLEPRAFQEKWALPDWACRA